MFNFVISSLVLPASSRELFGGLYAVAIMRLLLRVAFMFEFILREIHVSDVTISSTGCPPDIGRKIWEIWDFIQTKYGTNMGFSKIF